MKPADAFTWSGSLFAYWSGHPIASFQAGSVVSGFWTKSYFSVEHVWSSWGLQLQHVESWKSGWFTILLTSCWVYCDCCVFRIGINYNFCKLWDMLFRPWLHDAMCSNVLSRSFLAAANRNSARVILLAMIQANTFFARPDLKCPPARMAYALADGKKRARDKLSAEIKIGRM